MSLAAEATRCENEVEKQCSLILKTDPEFWEIRNKAILALTDLVARYDRHPNVQDIIGMSVFRLLKEPIKNMMADLRSQQVRDTCAFLSRLSQVTGDHMRHFLRDSFAFILDGVKVPNKVMSGFVDDCIISMIKNSTFKTALHTLLVEIKESKAKVVRERCLDYMNEILVHWDLIDKDTDAIAEAITVGLEDASVRGREIARLAYLNLFVAFPRKTERLKAALSSSALRAKLSKQEEQHVFLLKQQEAAAAAAASAAAAIAAAADAAAAAAATEVKSLSEGSVSTIDVTAIDSPEHMHSNSQPPSAIASPSPRSSPIAVRGVVVAVLPPAEAPHLSSLALLEPAPEPRGSTPTRFVSLSGATGSGVVGGMSLGLAGTPGKLSLRVRRQSCQVEAVTSIQAIVRGTLTRRQSISGTGAGSGMAGSMTPRLSAISSPDSMSMSTSGPASASPLVSPTSPSLQQHHNHHHHHHHQHQQHTPPRSSPNNRLAKSPASASAPSAASASPLMPVPIERKLSAASPRRLSAIMLLPSSPAAIVSSAASQGETKIQEGQQGDASRSQSATARGPTNSPRAVSESSNVIPSTSPSIPSKLVVGAGVKFQLGPEGPVRRGVVRFVGLTSMAPGSWVGVDVTVDKGDVEKENGAAGSGVFIRAEQVLSVSPPNQSTSAIISAPSPSNRQSSPWLPSSSSPRHAPSSPFAKLSKNDSKRRLKVASLLKIKAAQMVALLGKELELIEQLEDDAAASTRPLGKPVTQDPVAEILALTAQETQLLNNFQDRLKASLHKG